MHWKAATVIKTEAVILINTLLKNFQQTRFSRYGGEKYYRRIETEMLCRARAEENLSRSEAQNKHHEELITMKRSEGKRIDRLAFCIRSLLA